MYKNKTNLSNFQINYFRKKSYEIVSILNLSKKLDKNFFDKSPELHNELSQNKNELYNYFDIDYHKDFIDKFLSGEIIIRLGNAANYGISKTKIYCSNNIEILMMILAIYIRPLLSIAAIIYSAYYFDDNLMYIALLFFPITFSLTQRSFANPYSATCLGGLSLIIAIGILIYYIIISNYQYVVFTLLYIYLFYNFNYLRANYLRMLQVACIQNEYAIFILLRSSQIIIEKPYDVLLREKYYKQ